MDAIKKGLNKGFDKATNVNNEPQVLNKSSHTLNTTSINDRHSSLTGGIDHHLEKPHDPSRSVGAMGTMATGVPTNAIPSQDRRLSAQNQYRHDMGYAPSSSADPCYGGTGPQLGLHRASTGSIGSDVSVEGVGLGMQSHGRYEHRQPSLQEQKRGERMGWDIGEHFDV